MFWDKHIEFDNAVCYQVSAISRQLCAPKNNPRRKKADSRFCRQSVGYALHTTSFLVPKGRQSAVKQPARMRFLYRLSVPPFCLQEGLQYCGGGNSIKPFSFLASSKITRGKLSLSAETAQPFVLKVDRNLKVLFKLFGKVQNTPGLRALRTIHAQGQAQHDSVDFLTLDYICNSS